MSVTIMDEKPEEKRKRLHAEMDAALAEMERAKVEHDRARTRELDAGNAYREAVKRFKSAKAEYWKVIPDPST